MQGGYFCRQISCLLVNLLQNITLYHQTYEWGVEIFLQTDFLTVMKSATQISWLLGNLPERFTLCEQCGGYFFRQISWLLGNMPHKFYYYSLSPNLQMWGGSSTERFPDCYEICHTDFMTIRKSARKIYSLWAMWGVLLETAKFPDC